VSVRERTAAPIDVRLLERVLEPFERSRTLPAEAYTSPRVLEWERRHFFEGSWACVGRGTDLKAAGDQRAIAVGEGGILLVRDERGALNAFHNTCRHRGHELLECGATRSMRAIKCPYHAWVYGLDGALRGAPRFGSVPGFDKAEFPLVAVRAIEWHGWVFVNASADAPAFADHVGNLDAMVVAPYTPERLVVGASHTYDIRANWKIVVENYLECYHCSSIHPELCHVTPPESDQDFPEPASGAWTGGPMELREHASTMSLSGESLGVTIPALPAERARQVAYAALLPNILISCHPDYVMTHRLTPVATNRTRVECEWLFPPEAFERPGFDPSYATEFWDITNREDWAACESVQRSAESAGYRQGPMSTWEICVYDAMTMVARGYLEGRLSPPQRQLAWTAEARDAAQRRSDSMR
jgi:glycine betaine catabolism A